jgi:hypothetical protein
MWLISSRISGSASRAADAVQPLEVQPVQQFLMNLRLQFLVVRLLVSPAAAGIV